MSLVANIRGQGPLIITPLTLGKITEAMQRAAVHRLYKLTPCAETQVKAPCDPSNPIFLPSFLFKQQEHPLSWELAFWNYIGASLFNSYRSAG